MTEQDQFDIDEAEYLAQGKREQDKMLSLHQYLKKVCPAAPLRAWGHRDTDDRGYGYRR